MTVVSTDPGALLTSAAAGDLLRAALAPEGASVDSWTVDEVNARPGAETSVGYQVRTTRLVNGSAAGCEEYLVATTYDPPEVPDGCLRLVNAADPAAPTITVWRHPADPLLPALAQACDVRAVAHLWQRLLGSAAGADDQVEIVAYRPMRRAVVRATRGDYQVYLKVVRPKQVRELVARHQLLRDAGVPTPPVLEHTREGIVVVDHAEGTRLVDLIAGAEPSAQVGAVEPAVLVDLLESLPAGALGLTRRRPWAENYDTYAAFLDARLGVTAATELGERLATVVAGRDLGPVVATHGDFHSANIFLGEDGRVSALLDVDTLGPGHRVDDLACFLAHLAVLPTLDPTAYPGVPALLGRCLADFAGRAPEDLLRARAAACVVSLACGAPTDDLARQWLDAACRLAVSQPSSTKESLTGTSSTVHQPM